MLLLEPVATPPDAASDDPTGELERVAAAWAPLPRFQRPPAVAPEGEDLEEAAWTATAEHLHPRWPSGTPGGLGGEFMRVGQVFNQGGKSWEVSSIAEGHVIAHEASGAHGHAETRIFDPAKMSGPATEMGGITRPEAQHVAGGKHGSNVAVVDPYVDQASHDPSLTLPEGSKLNAEQWQRFGRAEQLHYRDLMARYGKHTASGASNLITKAYQEYDHEIQNLVSGAYSSQYGSSSGYTLSLTSIFNHLTKDKKALEAARAKRERGLELEGRIRDAYSWDLYNRTRSPDVTLFHKDGSHGSSWWKDFIHKPQNIFSGLSQSHHFRKSFFGSTAIATPMSIRHVSMATYVAGPMKGSQKSFVNEKEMAIPHQFKVDQRSIAFDNSEIPHSYLNWLENTTTTPQGGGHLEKFKDAVEHGGTLPIPPPAPDINLHGKGALPPPQAALEALGDYADKLPEISSAVTPETLKATGLPFEHVDSKGLPEAKTALDLGVKPGDYILGKQGTVYWAGPNPNDPSGFGLTLNKLVPEGGGSKKMKPNGETFTFDTTHENYKLKSNVPPPKAEGSTFDPEGWVFSDEKAVPISQFQPGEKFKVDGQAYEVQSGGNANSTPIVHLDSGSAGAINSDYQSVKIIPKEGYLSPNAKLTPVKGMTLAYDGKKHIVTNVKKDGTVSIKPTSGGKVIPLAHDDEALDGLFDHMAWKKGSATQIGALELGDYFHGGRGEVIRPHRLDSKDESWAYWTNLDTGESGKSLLKKKVGTLAAIDGTSADDKPPALPTSKVTPEPDGTIKHGEAKPGDTVALAQIAPEQSFDVGNGGIAKVVEHTDNQLGENVVMVSVQMGDGSWSNPVSFPDGGKFKVLDTPPEPDSGDDFPHHGYATGQTVELKKKSGKTWKAEVVGSSTKTFPAADGGSGNTYNYLEVKASNSSKVYSVNVDKVVTANGAPAFSPDDPSIQDPTLEFDHANAHDKVVDGLPDISASVQGYKSAWGSGGKYKHDKISEMPSGTVFQDKTGKKWKVQNAGATPVITDGFENYTVDGSIRGRALTGTELVSPPPPSNPTNPEHAPTETHEYQSQAVPNDDDLSLAEIPVGSYVSYGKMDYKVVDGGIKNLDTGEFKPTAGQTIANTVPDTIKLSGPPLQKPVGSGLAGETWTTDAGQKLQYVVTKSDGKVVVKDTATGALADVPADVPMNEVRVAPPDVPDTPPVEGPPDHALQANLNSLSVDELPVGSKYEVGGGGGVWTKTSSDKVLSATGNTFDIEHVYQFVPEKVALGPGEAPPQPDATEGLVPNTGGLSVYDLPQGTKFTPPEGPGFTGEAMTKTSSSGMIVGDQHVPSHISPEAAQSATEGLPVPAINSSFATGTPPPELKADTETSIYSAQQTLDDAGTGATLTSNTKSLAQLPVGSYFKNPWGNDVYEKTGDAEIMRIGTGAKVKITSNTAAIVPDHAALPSLSSSESDLALGEMEAGDEFENVTGHPFEFVGVASNGAVVKDLQSGQLQQLDPGTDVSAVQPKPAPAVPAATEVDGPGLLANPTLADLLSKLDDEALNTEHEPLQPYKSAWGSGGKYKHDKLSELQPGDKFRDKGGNAYVLVKSVGGGYVLLYKPSKNTWLQADGNYRVRKLDS